MRKIGHFFAVAATIGLIVLGSKVSAARADTTSEASQKCPPSGEVTFVCGIIDPEDIDVVPGGQWIVASSTAFYGRPIGPGHLIFVNIATHARYPAADIPRDAVARTPYKDCLSPPEPFSPHGIALRPGRNGSAVLYAVNHGREDVEVFDVTGGVGSKPPIATWVGCVAVPPGAYLNAVAPMADGGLVVTSLGDKNLGGLGRNLAAGRSTGGRVFRWKPGQSGAEPIPNSEGSGNNGIAVGKHGVIFVSLWGARTIMRLQPEGDAYQRSEIPIDFGPDNMKWWPSGELAIGGQRKAPDAAPCQLQECRVPGFLALLDPKTMAVRTIYQNDGQSYSNLTTGLHVGNEIWLGSVSDDRLAILHDADKHIARASLWHP